jgi:hypothetical protein
MARIAVVLLILAVTLPGAYQSASPPLPPAPGIPSQPSPALSSGTLTVFDSLATSFDDYRWPTEAGKIVTSTFGEFRRTHFHAGIDISSGDVTGYRVFAARDGYVSRIRVDATGYGKMLYVRHPDGYTTTYAHLKNFAPAIEARAAAEQRRLARYTIDLDCPPEALPVRKGDPIAYSGETGTGSPHLHFEIRDGRMNPLNPFLAAPLRVYDSMAPTIRRIAVLPLHPGATVDGREGPLLITVRPAGSRHATIAPPIVVTGSAGFAVDARDQINGSHFRNGVYGFSLFIDGKQAFTVRLDRTPARQAQESGLYYDEELLEERRGRFERLFMELPNDLPFYAPRAPGAGAVDGSSLSPGEHRFAIVATDFNGNSADVSGVLVIARPPDFTVDRKGDDLLLHMFEPAALRRVVIASRTFSTGWTTRTIQPGPPDGSGTLAWKFPALRGEIIKVTAENAWGVVSSPRIIVGEAPPGQAMPLVLSAAPERDGVRVLARTDGVFTSPPQVTATEGAIHSTVVMVPKDVNEYTGWFRPALSVLGTRRISAEAAINGRPANAATTIELYPVAPRTAGTIAFDGGRCTLAYDSLSVLTPLLIRCDRSPGPDGTVYFLEPEGVIVRDGFIVTIADTSSRHSGLFFRSTGNWELIGTRETGFRSGRISRTLGACALLVDDVPPVVSRITITGTAWRKPTMRFRFSDALAGIEYDELKVYIDGAVVIPEIDGEHHRALVQPLEPLERGPHQLTIHLKDRMGNATTAERRFVLR